MSTGLSSTNSSVTSLSTSTSTGLSSANSSITSLSTSTSTGINSLSTSTSTGLSSATSSITSLSTSTSTAIETAKTHYYSVNDGGVQQANYNNNGATGINSLAAGAATAAGASSVAVGNAANAAGASGVAVGNAASASASNAVAIGPNAVASNVGARGQRLHYGPSQPDAYRYRRRRNQHVRGR